MTAKPAPVSQPSRVPTVTREQALDLLKRYFPVPDGPGKVEASLSTRGSRLMWEITVTDERSVGGLPAARGEIDAHSGQIRTFRRIGHERGAVRTGPLPAPRPEAEGPRPKTAAIALVQRYYSPLLADLKLETHSALADTGFGYGNSCFFQRYLNGIPVGVDGLGVSIDPDAKAWTDISMHWTAKVAFPIIDCTIIMEDASDRFFAGQEPLLVYELKEVPGSAGYGGFISYTHETARPQATMLVYQLDVGAEFPGYGMLDARALKLDQLGGSGLVPAVPLRTWLRCRLRSGTLLPSSRPWASPPAVRLSVAVRN